MTLLSSFKKVKGACVNGHLGALSHVLVKDGWMLATDSRMTAGAPCSVEETFMVPGAELEKALTILGEQHKLKVDEGKIIVSEGSRRVTITTLDPSVGSSIVQAEGAFAPVPKHFRSKLQTAASFMSEDKTKVWACSVRIRGEHLFATNNVSLIRIDCEGWDAALDVTLPDWIVEYVLGRDESVTEVAVEPTFVCFKFADGSWVRSTRLSQEMPDMVPDKLQEFLDMLGDPDFAISDEWRRAWGTVTQLSDESVTIAPDRLQAGKGQALVVAEVPSPVEDDTIWHPKFLGKVISVATHFDPRHYPKPAAFKGTGLTGVIAGKV